MASSRVYATPLNVPSDVVTTVVWSMAPAAQASGEPAPVARIATDRVRVRRKDRRMGDLLGLVQAFIGRGRETVVQCNHAETRRRARNQLMPANSTSKNPWPADRDLLSTTMPSTDPHGRGQMKHTRIIVTHYGGPD